jgi:hypothetical protein
MIRMIGSGGVLAHDAVFNLVEGQEVPAGLPGAAFVGIDWFDLAEGMTPVDRAVVRVVASTKPCLASTAACSLRLK